MQTEPARARPGRGPQAAPLLGALSCVGRAVCTRPHPEAAGEGDFSDPFHFAPLPPSIGTACTCARPWAPAPGRKPLRPPHPVRLETGGAVPRGGAPSAGQWRAAAGAGGSRAVTCRDLAGSLPQTPQDPARTARRASGAGGPASIWRWVAGRAPPAAQGSTSASGSVLHGPSEAVMGRGPRLPVSRPPVPASYSGPA